MAAIKLVYIGGGSTRAPGTLAAFVEHARYFDGSEIVLVDLDPERLHIVRALGQRMIEYEGIDLRLSVSTDRRSALAGADAVLTGFRPGGFEARRLDESLPLKHNVIGQETEGPGGFFLALRSLPVLREIVTDMEQVCPDAWLFNYTKPVSIIGEALAHHSAIRAIGLSAGPLLAPRAAVAACRLDPAQLGTVMVGLNNAGWTVKHDYAGASVIPLMQAALERVRADANVPVTQKRMVELACRFEALPAEALTYYYYRDEVLAELKAAPQTRADQIMAEASGYWEHYAEQADADRPVLDPQRSRGGLLQLELAAQVLAAVVEDLDQVYPCNVPNNGGALPTLAPERVVEIPCLVNEEGATPLAQPALPSQVSELVDRLGAYQALAAEAAWSGTRAEAIAALAANPLVPDAETAEALYNDLAAAHRAYLPARLLDG